MADALNIGVAIALDEPERKVAIVDARSDSMQPEIVFCFSTQPFTLLKASRSIPVWALICARQGE